MLKAMKKKMKDQRGLTLVELLAVIVILGIIAAIAVPSIGGLVNKSKDDAALADAIQIIGAAKLANAAGVPGPWDYDEIGEYISKAADDEFEVKVVDGKYSIKAHEEAARVMGITANVGTTYITEEELVKKTQE
jgi:type IV pilus assembly protein PilA